MKADSRHRLYSLIAGGMVAWTVGWYVQDGVHNGILTFSILAAILATAFPTWVLQTWRSRIWVGLLLLIVALSVNLDRIAPPEEQIMLGRTFFYDRIATFSIALSIGALFWPATRSAVTLLTVGCFPMLLLIVSRTNPQTHEALHSPLIIWVNLSLYLLCSQIQNATRQRDRAISQRKTTEWRIRIGFTALAGLLAALLAIPLGAFVPDALRWLYAQGFGRQSSGSSRADTMLTLAAPPGGFAERMRPLIMIEAKGTPGYLRTRAYRDYVRGTWVPPSSASGLAPLQPEPQTEAHTTTYLLPPAVPSLPAVADWRVRVIAPHRFDTLGLPQAAIAFQLAEPREVVVDPDDVLRWRQGVSANAFTVFLDDSTWTDDLLGLHSVGSAYPVRYPATTEIDSGYLMIPDPLQAKVMRWAAECEGLSAAASSREAMEAVTRHFNRYFQYRLEGPRGRESDLLERFMAAREGHCTLFATAAALMLRSQGIPTRVVAGYLSTERHPVLDQWVVRERDGHAWCEAWDAEAGGWRRVEATPANGLPTGFAPPGSFRAWLEAAGFGWRSMMDFIREHNPLVALAEAGALLYIRIEIFLTTPIGRLLAILLSIGALYIVWKRRQPPTSTLTPEQELKQQLIKAMNRWMNVNFTKDLHRQPHETWPTWHHRIAPHVSPELNRHLAQTLDQYQDLRFRPVTEVKEAMHWMTDLQASQSRHG